MLRLLKRTYNTCKSDNKYTYSLNEMSPSGQVMLPSPKRHRLSNKKPNTPTPGIKSPLLGQKSEWFKRLPKRLQAIAVAFGFPQEVKLSN